MHGGRTTQLWDAEVKEERFGKTIALFRCTQILLYPDRSLSGYTPTLMELLGMQPSMSSSTSSTSSGT